MDAPEASHIPGMKAYGLLLIGLFCIVAIEVILTYRHLPETTLLAWLLILAVIEALIAVTFYMHLKYEQPKLIWSLFVAFVFVLFMMLHMFPDAVRLLHLRVLHW
jgi:cytochrome c oxidase subunit IV